MFKRKLLLAIIGLLPWLTGCVPAAFVAGAAVGGAVLYDQRSVSTIVKDRDITFQAQRKIDNALAERSKEHSRVVVATFNRVVLLVGQVSDPALKEVAAQILQGNAAIKGVYNEIRVGRPITNEVCRHDTWLTSQVIAALTLAKGLHASQIKVVTEDGNVYLMGVLTRAQGQLAAETAQKVDGVKQIVKVFEYL